MKPGERRKDKGTVVSNYGEPFEFARLYSYHGLIEVKEINKIKDGYEIETEVIAPPFTKIQRYTEREKDMIGKDYLVIEIKDHPYGKLSAERAWLVKSGEKTD